MVTERLKCACPILTEYAIRLNDRFNDDHRQRLKPYIELLIGTKSIEEVQLARKRFLRWRHVTRVYPLILDLYQFPAPDLANQLRTFKNSLEEMALASKLLEDNKNLIYKAANATVTSYTTVDTDIYMTSYANTVANIAAYDYALANANVYASNNANPYDSTAYINADTHPSTDAYTNVEAYANANPYANADNYIRANALREKLVETHLETLKMAIGIGEWKGRWEIYPLGKSLVERK